MEDKLHQFFSDNDFDTKEPHSGHLDRFERKLSQPKSTKKTSWKWLSVAASVVLLIGFYFGKTQQKDTLDLADISPKMEEVQTYFVNTISQEIKELERNRNLDTEAIIEEALEEIEELEYNYNIFLTDLNKNGSKRQLIKAMINNYQQRLIILENVLKQIDLIKNPQKFYDEEYI